MIRPLYRWTSGWLGVLVIVFVGWVWLRSISRMEGWEYSTTLTGPGVIAQRSGTVVFAWNDPTAGGDPVRLAYSAVACDVPEPDCRCRPLTFTRQSINPDQRPR